MRSVFLNTNVVSALQWHSNINLHRTHTHTHTNNTKTMCITQLLSSNLASHFATYVHDSPYHSVNCNGIDEFWKMIGVDAIMDRTAVYSQIKMIFSLFIFCLRCVCCSTNQLTKWYMGLFFIRIKDSVICLFTLQLATDFVNILYFRYLQFKDK